MELAANNAVSQTNDKGKDGDLYGDKSTLQESKQLFTSFRYLAAFVLNQLAGIVFNILVAVSDLSIASPVTNAISFIATYIAQLYFKGTEINHVNLFKFYFGTFFIVVGMYLVINK